MSQTKTAPVEMPAVCSLDGTALVEAISEKRLSPVEIVDAFLQQIDRVNPKVNAFCLVLDEQAGEEAKAAEAAVMKGEPLGPLHGVPFAVKDLTVMAGVTTTFGSRVFRDFVPDTNAIIVDRVKRAGGIVLGKTNTPEFAHCGITNNRLFGPTRNPWNLDKMSGGSSGGAGAAIATAMAPLAEGTDGGGSVRMPSAANGIYGLKPQFGRVPVGILETHYETLLHFGPMTWTVRDAALLLNVMAGPDEGDPHSLPNTGENYLRALEGGIQGWKVAVSPDLGYFAVDPEVRNIFHETVGALEELGCEVEEVEIKIENPIETVQNAWLTLWRGLIAALFGHLVPEHTSEMTQYVVDLIENGKKVSAVDYQRAQINRSRLWDTMRPIFEEYRLLITPTTAVPAFDVHAYSFGPEEIDGQMIHPYMGWWMTYPFNMTGQPAASIPAGFAASGVPIGMQIVGRRYREDDVLRASAAFEKTRPWHERRPEVAL